MRRYAILLAATLFVSACSSGGGSGPSGPSTPAVTSAVPPSAGVPSAGSAASGQPASVLHILSPHSGDQLTLPAPVQYAVDALPPAATLRIYSGTTPAGGHRDYPLTSAQGQITLPDDKTLTGYRDLTFCLATADQLIAATCQTLHLALFGRK
jgi:hypothetical protein